MNLIDDPWVPVIFPDGRVCLVGLRELYERSGEIHDLILTPPQRVAVMRLLVCITQAALDGPEDETEWLGCEDRIVPSSVRYLEEQRERFDLFGSQPFMQIGDLGADKMQALDKLDFGLASGNNSTLFDQEARPDGRAHSAAWAALNLLTFLNFSPGGKVGQAIWRGHRFSESTTASPCIQAAHVYVRGESLRRTVFLNLLSKKRIATLPNGQWGFPVWEMFPEKPDEREKLENATTTYLGRLVPLSRLIRLFPHQEEVGRVVETCIIGPPPEKLTFQHLPAYREPTTTVIETKSGETDYLKVMVEKHIWRELGSALALGDSMAMGGALALSNLRLVKQGENDTKVDIWVGGLRWNSKENFEDSVEWNLLIPVQLLGEIPLNRYQEGVQHANRGAGQIEKAVFAYLTSLKAYDGKDESSRQTRRKIAHRVEAIFWQTLDQEYEILFSETMGNCWPKMVQKAMKDAYRDACPHATPRQIQAFESGWRLLHIK